MTEIEIDISVGHVRAIPVPSPVAGQVVLAGPGRLMGWSMRENGAESALANEGSVLAPAANAAIVSLPVVPAGLYNYTWTVSLTGAAAAADVNNFAFINGFATVNISLNPGTAGVYLQLSGEINVPTTDTVFIKAIGNATAGVTYGAQISLTPVSPLQAILELRDGGQALAEIGVGQGLDQTRWLGPLGVKFMNQISLNPVQGSMTGVIFAAFHRM